MTDSPDYELAFDYQRAGPSGAPKSRDRVSVFRVRTSGTRLIVPGIAVADPESSPERLSWNVRIADGHGMRQAVAAVSWHPNWTALVDGREAPITRTYLWTMRFAVAPGAHRVTLEFQRSPRERLYNVLSAVTLGLVVFLWVRELRGRRASGR